MDLVADHNRQEQPVDDSILGAAKIAPDIYSVGKNKTFLDRSKYALSGILHLFAHHPTIRLMAVVTILGALLAFWLQVSVLNWLLLLLVTGQLWVTEILNTAIEATVDLVTEGEIRPLAKVAKDVGAAATAIASLLAAVVTLFVLLPPLIDKFF